MAYNQFLKNSTRFKSSNYDTRVMKLELGTSSKMEFVQWMWSCEWLELGHEWSLKRPKIRTSICNSRWNWIKGINYLTSEVPLVAINTTFLLIFTFDQQTNKKLSSHVVILMLYNISNFTNNILFVYPIKYQNNKTNGGNEVQLVTS